MARNRPGKRERLALQRQEIAKQRFEAIARNMAEPKPERPVYGSPKGYRASIAHRDNLRSHSHDIGFVGPRGFKSPKDIVSKQEATPGLLAPYHRTSAERERARELAASVRVPVKKD